MPLMDGKKKKMEYRRSMIAELFHLGYQTQFAIVDALDEKYGIQVSQSTVSRDLEIVNQRWIDASVKEIGEAKAIAVAELNEIKAEMLQAWRDSIGEKVVVIEKTTTAGNIEVVTNKKWTTGNSQYMELYLKCFEKQMKILGVYAPIEVNWQENLPEGFNAMEVQEIFARRVLVEQKSSDDS
jgi:arginine repressor